MILVLDNRDSFTFNLVQALQAHGHEVCVRRADATSVADIRELAPERILIGPGPGGPTEAGCSVETVRTFAGRVPILGVCLGHQALGAAYGARIGRAPELVHGRAVSVDHDGRGLFHGLPTPLAMARYNSLTVLGDGLPECLEVSARSADGDVMALRHRELPLEGVQFHPESILSSDGAGLLANFVAG